MSINLTNHKEKIVSGKTYQHKPHLIDQLDRANQFEGKFDKFFCTVGHSFTMAFDVIRESYWLEYGIIEHFDCSVYDTIYFFIRKNIPFSLDVLARKMHVSKGTLRESLDNLENAELLEIVKVNDERGQYNCYLLKSPLFERESIEFNSKYHPESNHNKAVQTTRDKFHKKGLPLPTEFLEDHVERLKQQVKKNNVRRVRLFLRDKLKSSKFKRLATELREQREARQFVWKEIFHTLGSNANDFEQFIFSHTKELAVIPTAKGEFKQALIRFVKSFCEKFDLVYNTWFVDKAEKLFEFFRIRLRIPKAKAEESYYSDAPPEPKMPEESPFAEVDEDFETDKKEQVGLMLRKILADKTEKSRTDNAWRKSVIHDISRLLRDYLSVFTVDELEKIATEYLPFFIMEKVLVELRN